MPSTASAPLANMCLGRSSSTGTKTGSGRKRSTLAGLWVTCRWCIMGRRGLGLFGKLLGCEAAAAAAAARRRRSRPCAGRPAWRD